MRLQNDLVTVKDAQIYFGFKFGGQLSFNTQQLRFRVMLCYNHLHNRNNFHMRLPYIRAFYLVTSSNQD